MDHGASYYYFSDARASRFPHPPNASMYSMLPETPGEAWSVSTNIPLTKGEVAEFELNLSK